jgi:hypothetical protein
MAPSADIQSHLRYIERHELIPVGLETWTEGQLRSLVEGAKVSGTEAAWERALVLLAHHPSQTARGLLQAAKRWVPDALRGFWELAASESLCSMDTELEREALPN